LASAETATPTENTVVPKRPVGRPRKNSTHPLDIQKQQQLILLFKWLQHQRQKIKA
jgi:hypothetical protein